MKRSHLRRAPVLGLLILAGCAAGGPPRGEREAPAVSVAQVTQGEVLDYVDFTGRTEAVASVTIKARATGYLEKVLFKDGDDVKEGQLLYEIDQRTYEAEVKNAEGVLANAATLITMNLRDYARVPGLQAEDWTAG